MDSNLYTKILDDQYEKGKQNLLNKNLPLKFKLECEKIPYLQQCKLYDC
jgi:hypothetical protein|tara:strand:- start:2646 stop:2792 length:147 start_codon:yes stop_codon:yes gene_type:complete